MKIGDFGTPKKSEKFKEIVDSEYYWAPEFI